ncbi:11667_t:CDS:2, partial [Rhizophagus irregularis]
GHKRSTKKRKRSAKKRKRSAKERKRSTKERKRSAKGRKRSAKGRKRSVKGRKRSVKGRKRRQKDGRKKKAKGRRKKAKGRKKKAKGRKRRQRDVKRRQKDDAKEVQRSVEVHKEVQRSVKKCKEVQEERKRSIKSFKDRYDNDDLNINPENSVDDFFDNIADYEEDFNFIQNNENAFHLAMKRALDNNSDSSVNNDFEDEANDYDTNKSETTANTRRGYKSLHCDETKIHLGEITTSLELMANWILQIAHERDLEFQEKVLATITPALQQLDSNLILQKSSNNNTDNSSQEKNISSPTPKISKIPKNPQSLNEYQNAIPIELYNLFSEIVEKLLFNRCQMANVVAKSRKKEYIPKEVNQKKVQKISTMLSSIILTMGFTNTSFWLTRSLATVSKKDRAVNGRRELFWALVNSLLVAFESSNPTNHPLFQNCIELTDSGYTKLFSCYDKGKERLKQIYRQEVLRIDPINTKGRRAKEVVITKTKDIKNAEQEEKSILKPYFKSPKPSNEEIEKVLDSLLELSPNYWTKKKVKAAWGYAQKKK